MLNKNVRKVNQKNSFFYKAVTILRRTYICLSYWTQKQQWPG